MRLATFVLPTVLALALAPVQCSKKYDESLRREDSAGDGLWSLAEDFHAKGDDKSYEATLRFLLKRYPSSRRAPKARQALEQRGAAATTTTADTAAPTAPPAASSAPATTQNP
jgi:hypothetical protein